MATRFTDRELDIMSILWQEESATARTVHSRLEDDLAYTTVLTVLRTMRDKGFVRREEEGRAYRFYPEVPRDEAGETALDHLIEKFYGGSADRFLSHLVSDAPISDEELDRLRRDLEERFGEGGDE